MKGKSQMSPLNSGRTFQKIMFNFILIISLLFLIIILVNFISRSSKEGNEVKALLAESCALRDTLIEVRDQQGTACRDTARQIDHIQNQIRWLKEAPLDEAGVREIRASISNFENQIAQYRIQTAYASITDPKEREALLKSTGEEAARLEAQLQKTQDLFDAKIETLKQTVAEKESLFEDIMTPCFLCPKEACPAFSRREIKVTYYSGTTQCEWWDDDTEIQPYCWAEIRLVNESPVTGDIKVLDEESLIRYFLRSILIQTGYFEVQFRFRARKDQSNSNPIPLDEIKSFIDLERLGRLSSIHNNEYEGLLVTGLNSAKAYRDIKGEMEDEIQPIKTEISNVESLKDILEAPPAEADQLDYYRGHISNCIQHNQQSAEHIELGMMDEASRMSLLKKLEEKRALLKSELQHLIRPYDKELSKLRHGLSQKTFLLNDALKKYFLDGRAGNGDSYNKVMYAYFDSATMQCIWKNPQGDPVYTAQLNWYKSVEVPENLEKLDNRYSYKVCGMVNESIALLIGNIHILFEITEKQSQGTEDPKQIVRSYVDLRGLEKISTF